MSANIYSVIVTILYAMRLQLDAQDDIYIKQRYGKETLCHFAILNDSNLVGERQTCLLNAITLAHASTTNQHANSDSASRRANWQEEGCLPCLPLQNLPQEEGHWRSPKCQV